MFNAPPSLPPDLRLYVFGDIHGRLDLLKQLFEKIDADKKKSSVRVKKIFLGDYIDRGLQSRQTLDFLLAQMETDEESPVFLLGNHEQVMRDVLQHQDLTLMNNWLRFGGRETMMSYGVRPAMFSAFGNMEETLKTLLEKTPEEHLKFLKAMPTSITLGDYYFCHAGARPGVPLAAQAEGDLVWIRKDFLAHESRFEKMIVHGHTICDTVEFKPNRINIDTGAYATGCLTALALEGTEQWLIQTNV